MPTLPDLESLALLVKLSRSGSIGAAAREAGIAQQSASERLAGLERQVGVPLLQRGARGTGLTAAGTVVVEWSARLLQAAEEVQASMAALRAGRDQELRIVASMTVAEHLLPRWLVAFRTQQLAAQRPAPSVSLRASNTTDVLHQVLTGAADLGFVEGSHRPAGIASREIADDELILVVAPGDRLARRRRPLTPAEVAALALTSREEGSGTRDVVAQALAAHGLEMAAPAVEVTTSTAVRETVRAGGAPGFLSRRAVETDLRTGAVVQVPTAGLDTRRSLRAVWVGARQPPAGPIRDLLAVIGRAGGVGFGVTG